MVEDTVDILNDAKQTLKESSHMDQIFCFHFVRSALPFVPICGHEPHTRQQRILFYGRS